MDVARENILRRVRAGLSVEAHRPLPPTDAPVFPPVIDVEARFARSLQRCAVRSSRMTGRCMRS